MPVALTSLKYGRKNESRSEENVTENTITDNTDFEPIVKKRGKRTRYVTITILIIIVSIPVIIIGFMKQKQDECYNDKTLVNITSSATPNKLALTNLFTIALVLYGIVLGTLVGHLSLVFEECRHLYSRYDGSLKKMVKACLSGIDWHLVFVLLGLATIIVVFLIVTIVQTSFELIHLMHVFGGIGVGPLIMHLLNLNTKSEVYISTVLEEREMRVAKGLALSYYFDYLQCALPKFTQIINRPFPVPYEHFELSLNKLLLLIPLDGRTKDDLNSVDRNIKNVVDIGDEQDPYHFRIYSLAVNEHEKKHFAIEYAKQPLRYLTTITQVQGKTKSTLSNRLLLKNEVKLFYRALCKILRNPLNENFTRACVLVPVCTSNGLENGGLVKCIMNVVERACTQAHSAPTPAKQKGSESVSEGSSSTMIHKSYQSAETLSCSTHCVYRCCQQKDYE